MDAIAVCVVAVVTLPGTVDILLDQLLMAVGILLHQDTVHSVADQHAVDQHSVDQHSVDQDVVDQDVVVNRVVTEKSSV